MWKCVFDSATNKGVAFGRQAGDGEFMVELPPAECAWFNSEPERYQYVDGVFSEVSAEVWAETLKVRARAANAAKAAAEVEVQLDRLAKNESRKSAGLPPLMNQASEKALKSHIQLVQAEADNPSDDIAWNPPLPPGVTAPAINSLSVVIKREPGWQDNLGFRVTLKAATEDYVPTNIALAVYSGPNCEGYQYTTGAFQQDAESGEYYAVCPAGFEPGNVAINFGLLYGAAQLSCFTLAAGTMERIVYAYEEV
jgi:hypothetical protein